MPDGLRESVYYVTLCYQSGPLWLLYQPNAVIYVFRCVGTSWGGERWRLHLAEVDRPLPKRWQKHPYQLLTALSQGLLAQINVEGVAPRSLVRITSDLIAEKGGLSDV